MYITKTIKLSLLAKHKLNLLAQPREEYLSRNREQLKEIAYSELRKNYAFGGLSLALACSVSYSRIISDAYEYCIEKYSCEEIKEKIIEIQNRDEKVILAENENQMLRLTFEENILDGISELTITLKPSDMKRPYRVPYIIMVLLTIAYDDDIYNDRKQVTK